MISRSLLLAAALMFLGVSPPARAQDECVRPWVVVVKKDGSLVEGWLLKDSDSGVLLNVQGRTVLVPEPEITEVVEDCSRVAPQGGTQRRASAAPLAPPAPSSDVEARARNSFINMAQGGMRWAGGACLSLGCGLFSTGFVMVIVVFLQAVTANPETAPLALAPPLALIMGVITVISAIFMGGGAGLFVGASLADMLRPQRSQGAIDEAPAAPPAQSNAPVMVP